MKRIVSLLLIISILLCSCAGNSEKNENQTSDYKGKISYQSGFTNAVWLSFFEISELVKGKTEEEFREEIINLCANLLSIRSDTLIVHTVAFCDSFYESDLLMKSKYIKSKTDFDVFGVICDACVSAGIEIQAWINPYRISSAKDLSVLKNNPTVRKLYSDDSNNIIITENEIYLNPAGKSVQRLILDEAREIIEKYPVGAIHLDDYFYPDMASFADRKSYEKYKKDGGALSVENWRRENVSSLISSLHTLTSQNNVSLVISPMANTEKNYTLKFADIPLWLENGWVNTVIPQVYFGFENETAPFEKTVDEWISLTENKDVKLVIGLAFYKCGKADPNAGSGKNEWLDNDDIISRQIRLILQKNTICGVAFFSYSHIFGKNIEKVAKKELQNIKSML